MTEGTALLLGCGTVGIAAARLLGQDRAFRQIVAADRDLRRAGAASELCGDKAVAVQLDCIDEEALARVLEDVSLVINTVRMPISVVLPFIRNVMEAGVSYADTSSDPEALQAIFDSTYLDALAEYRAIGVVPGLGASPGLTNAMTSYLGQRLERIDEASFYLVDDLRRRSHRQWVERLMAFGAAALIWRDDDWRYVSPLAECMEVSFPPPWGQVFCSTVGLGPVTLPTSIASIRDVSSHRGFVDSEMLDIIRNLLSYGFGSDEPVETAVGNLSPVEFAASLFSRQRDAWSGESASTLLFGSELFESPLVRQAQVAGMLGGRKTRFTMTYYFPGEQEADNVAATLAVGAKMLLTREIAAPGVHPPEYLDPAPFLWDMERRGVQIQLAKTIEE